VDLVEQRKRNGLHPLHSLVADPRHRAQPIDGPGDEVSRSRSLVRHCAHEIAARDHAAGSRVDDNLVLVGLNVDESVGAPGQFRASGYRLERVSRLQNARRSSGLLQIGQSDLKPLLGAQVRVRVDCSSTEIHDVDCGHELVGGGRVHGEVAPNDWT
jgi:hypothetical protein